MKAVETPQAPVKGAKLWPLTVPAYRALGEAGLIPKNTELLYGQVYQKMSKSPLHGFLVQLLHDALLLVLPQYCLLRTEQPITCGDSEPEPDLAVVRGRKEDFRNEHPQTAELVIEVCLSSHDYDRSKLRAYASAKVKEVWLVLAPEKQIEVYIQTGDGEFHDGKTHGPGGRLVSQAVPEFALDLDGFFSK